MSGPVGEYRLFTLPVTACHFGRLSLTALLAYQAILPVIPLNMVGADFVNNMTHPES